MASCRLGGPRPSGCRARGRHAVDRHGQTRCGRQGQGDRQAKGKGHQTKRNPAPQTKPSRRQTGAKAKTESKKPDPKAKTEAKPDAKADKDKKAAKKPDKEKAAAKPASKPATAQAAGALAPPVAAALKPALPKENGAAPPPDPAPGTTGQPQAIPAPANTIVTAAAIDVSAVKRAIELVRSRKQADASEIRKNISDPAAKKLVEWVILRSDDSGADFQRYAAFISANPNWPSIVTLRRKAEATAFQEQPPNAPVQAYFSQYPPLSAKGRFALCPRAARQRQPQGRRGPGARGVALRQLLARCRKPDGRDVR